MKHSFSWNQPSEVFRVFSRGFRKNRTLLVSMSAIVVFIATYMLILPAMTLDEEEAAGQGGIDVPGTEQITDAKAGQTEQSADTGGPAFEGDGYTISLEAGKEAKLPEGTELTAVEVTPEDKDYNAWCDEAVKALQESSAVKEDVSGLKTAKFYDITLLADGSAFEPADAVNVNISYDKALKMKDMDDVKVIHFCVNKKGNLKPEVLKDSAVDVKAKQGKKGTIEVSDVAFEATGFSMYGVVEMETLEKTVITADGKKYKVTVTYGTDANIPKGAELSVSEIASETEAYKDYVEKSEDALGMKKGSAGYARLFDIKILDQNENKVIIQAPVDVKIELEDMENRRDAKVVHFEDGNEKCEVMEDVEVDDKIVSFSADGFSVYAVVDDGTIADESRMALHFYNGEELIETVYVKNGDDTEEILKQIIYDPGAGTLNSGELFKGWILDKENYTTDDLIDKMDIEQIRAWAQEKANSNAIKEGEEHSFYAMIYKTFAVAYKDESGVTIHSEALIFNSAEEQVDYIVNEPYIPKEQDEAFQGWYWTNSDPGVADPIVAKDGSVAPFMNGTEVTIKDNITFTVNVPKGFWLSFVENEGSYTPPQFITSGGATEKPEDPTRLGYRFEGWYTNPQCTGNPFVFGNSISERTTLYAKWTPVENANYNVIIWKHNLAGDGYDFAEAITLSGPVGTEINTVVPNGSGNGRYARIGGTDKKYTGFFLNNYETNVTIAPEGTSVVNVYYDRIEYTVKFYYARTPNNNNNRAWSVATSITTDRELQPFTNRTTWTNTNQNRTSYGPSTQYELNNNNRYYYFTITALYGQDISAQWPKYSDFPDLGNYQLISWWMMHSATSWGGAGGGKDTVKGVISVMDEQLLGDPTSSDGNFLIARYSNSQPNVYNYKIWKELPDGFAIPEDEQGQPKQTTTRNGVRYYLDETLIAKANSDPGGIHQPSYLGFTEDTFTYRQIRSLGGGKYEYDVEMYYDRNKFEIVYMDGLYLNGDGVILDNQVGSLLKESGTIYYESDVHSYNKGGENYYDPSFPGSEYVFAGWYTDQSCQNEAVFSEIPDHNINVYAKWVQKQYRVFLHPNVPTSDTSLDFAGQSTSFRIDYGDKIAGGNQINPTRDDYDIIGWYTDEACTKPFNFDAFTLNDTTVTTPYDQTENTELDKYGNVESGKDGVNKDKENNRFWINNKLDLYAKWRARLEGANGINVIYDAKDGTNAPIDPLTYLDNSEATAGAASTPNNEEKQFMYWVVQTWNGTEYVDTEVTVYPGDIYTVLKKDAMVKVTEWVNPDDEDDAITVQDPEPGTTPPDDTHTKIKSASYTVQLRAEYEDKDVPTPTHIWWFPNNVSTDRHDAIKADNQLQINQAVVIPDAPERNGYRFLGWARVENTISDSSQISDSMPTGKTLGLNKEDLFLTYHQGQGDTPGYYTAVVNVGGQDVTKTVTRVAADENLPYHDMYAVWEKAYDVTIKKVVVSNIETDKEIEFSFTETQNIDSIIGTDSFVLKDREDKKYEDTFPAGSNVSVTEATNDDFRVTVTGKYTDEDGTEHVINNLTNGSNIVIQGDTEITFTNTRKIKTVRVYKIDDSATPVPLSEVGFKLGDNSLTTNESGYSQNVDLEPNSTPYQLEETHPLPGYTGLSGTVPVTVSNTGVTVPDGTDNVSVSGPNSNGIYTITVINPLKTVPLKVVKIDQERKPLAGATFEGDLIEGSITTEISGDGSEAEAIIINDNKVPLGNYTIRETNAPAGYNLLDGDVKITVNDNNGSPNVEVSIGGTPIAKDLIVLNHNTGEWTIKIMNTAGVELPSTGGAGTYWIYILGSALLLGCGITLIARRRTGRV